MVFDPSAMRVAGLIWQLASDGRFAQLSATVPANPPVGIIWIVTVAVCPAVRVSDAGEAVSV
jgi:hypothetical protein